MVCGCGSGGGGGSAGLAVMPPTSRHPTDRRGRAEAVSVSGIGLEGKRCCRYYICRQHINIDFDNIPNAVLVRKKYDSANPEGARSDKVFAFYVKTIFFSMN